MNVVFARPTAPCPECGIVLRKNQFWLQQFEDCGVEREVDIRKKILKEWVFFLPTQQSHDLSRNFFFSSYNKTRDDFVTLLEYNDYLEEVETISRYL